MIAALVWRSVLVGDDHTAFTGDARRVEVRLDERLEGLASAGRAARHSMLAQAPHLSERSFRELASAAVAGQPAGLVAGVAYVEPVRGDAGLVALRTRVRESGIGDFNETNLAPGEDHLIATYESPSATTAVFDGYDLAGIPSARAALEQARTEGRAVASDTFESWPTAAVRGYPALARSGIVVAVPVYADAATPVTLEDRIADLRGWVVAVVSAQDLLAGAVGQTTGVDAQLAEQPDPDAPRADRAGDLVASTALEGEGVARDLGDPDPATSYLAAIDHLGQHWELTVVDSDGLGDAATREPLWILIAGAALSVVLAALVWSLTTTRASALAMASAATREVRRSEARFKALVHNLPDLIVLTDDEQTISYISPSVSALLGWSPEDAEGESLVGVIHPEDRGRFAKALDSGGTESAIEVRVRNRDGAYRWFEGTVTNLYDDPAVAGLVITAHDVTAQKAIEDRLAHQATHDALTMLPNRVIVDDRLSHALDRGRRDGSRAAAIFLDIDEFKLVNDTWGHAAGDELLRQVAGRVARAARTADTVGRYGGDEFVVICEDLPSVADALVVAERIRDEVAQPVALGGAELLVGTSIGVALSSGRDEDTDMLLGRADAAMYEAKARGRGRIVIDADVAPMADG